MFDYKLLAQIAERLIAPKPNVQAIENQRSEAFLYAIDKNKFLNYLKTALDDQFVLQFEDKNTARPIVFHPAKSQVKANLFELVLDCSGSMQSVFKNYIEKVQHFVHELANQNNTTSDDVVRIVPFNQCVLEQKEIALGNISAIDDYLVNLNADSKTYFFGTLDQELSNIKGKCHDHNVTMIVFSDGEDNESCDKHETNVAQRMSELSRDVKPPKVITFGLGDHYQKQVMEELAANCGFQHNHLNNINDFQSVYDYVETAGLESVVFRLYQQAKQEVTQLYEGQIKTCETAFDTTESFTVNQQCYSVQTDQKNHQQVVEHQASQTSGDVGDRPQSSLLLARYQLFNSRQQDEGPLNNPQHSNSGSCVMQ